MDNVCKNLPIRRSGTAEIAQTLPLVETLDRRESSNLNSRLSRLPLHQFGHQPWFSHQQRCSFPELAQLVPKDNAGYTLYDLKDLILADGEAAALTIEITDPRGYAGFAVDGQLFVLGRHGNRNTKRDDGSGVNPFELPTT